jgi:hypothetical protein
MSNKSKTGAEEETKLNGLALLGDYVRPSAGQVETLVVGGRRKRMSMLEITVRQLRLRALKGDLRAFRDLLRLIKQAEKWRKSQPHPYVLRLRGADRII